MKTIGWIAIGMLGIPALAGAECGGGTLGAADAIRLVDFVGERVATAHYGGSAVDQSGYSRELARARAVTSNGMSQRELAAVLNRALAKLHDAHLEVRLTEEAEASCRVLPISLVWNTGGLWVGSGTQAVPAGSRVTRVGKLDVDDLQSSLAGSVPHETLQWLKAHAAGILVREDTLYQLGVVDGSNQVTIEFEAPDRGRRSARLSLGERRSAATDATSGYRILPESRTGHFWFHRFDYDAALVASFDRFLSDAAAADVEKIAIDIRGNPGGDSSVAVAILDALTDGAFRSFSVDVRPSAELAVAMPFLMPAAISPVLMSFGLPPVPVDASTYRLPAPLVLAQLRARVEQRPLRGKLPHRRLFLLTDGGTFSSGTLFAGLVRDNHLGLIVGEAAGNTATFNGSELRFDLAGTDYYLNLSSARLFRPDEQASGDEDIVPDHVVVPDGTDLAVGRDVALQWVIAQ